MMLTFLIIVGLIFLFGKIWKDVIPAGMGILSIIIASVWAWYMFWWIINAIFG